MDGPKQKQLEAMYEREAKNIYKYLYHLCQNKETAEDLTAETFLKAAKSLSGFRGECKESVWLCQIAKHLWFRELKRQKRMEALPEGRETASDQDVEAQVLASLGRLEWFQKMQGLEPVAREVMYLRLYGDLSFKEIGEVLGRTENWDSQMPMTMHAATDQVRYAWLYWLEEHVGLGGMEYEKVMIIPEEEVETAQILFTEIIPWDQGKEGASKVLYDRNTRLQPASEEMEQRLKDGKVYHYWLVNIPGYE